LDVCPNLTYRDIKWLIAKTAKKIDENNNLWVKNGANLWHNNNYGFGLINAYGMIKECTKPDFKRLPKLKKITKSISLFKNIPENGDGLNIDIDINEDIIIEWVGLNLDINHPYAGDIDVELYSPYNTKSHIIEPNFLKSNAYNGGFRFSSVAFMGERSKGVWKIKIKDLLKDDIGVLKGIKLQIWGH
jgi:kexin